MLVYAKSNPVETIEEHNKKLLNCYENLKPFLNTENAVRYDEVIRKIIYYHDLGKLNRKFQNKLGIGNNTIVPELKNDPELPHEWLSLAFISRGDKRYFHSFSTDKVLFCELVQYCIAYHHSRNKLFDKESLSKVIQLDLEKNKGALGIDYVLNADYDIEKDIKQKIDSQKNFKNYFELLVFLKGILHKCDYAASAGIEPEKHYIGLYEDDFRTWLFKKSWNLKPFQDNARSLSDKSVVLIAATGSGKTEYAMNWINGGKAFYLLGLKMAVNEMYKRFKAVFGNDKDNVALLHGDIAYVLDNADSDDDYTGRIERARKLSYPITVATADQLVTAVFKYNGFELAYLTASYSKVVVDEIQSFSPDSIAAIIVFVKEVHRLGGKFLLMTATLPPFVKDELASLPGIEFPSPELPKTVRHKIAVYEHVITTSTAIDIIKNHFNAGKKVLVVCNTVKKAQEMYDLLQDASPSLLHARFIQKDRAEKEGDIMSVAGPDTAGRKSQVIWIATQVVEASLDLDFDVLFTECSPIDSLFQRFGRCYRKREYLGEDANIHIFEAGQDGVYDGELLERTYKLLSEYYSGKAMSEHDKQSAIEKVFMNIENTRYYDKYIKNKKLLELGFRADSRAEAEKLFRNIAFNYSVVPRPVLEDNEGEIMDLITIIDNKDSVKRERIYAISKLKGFTLPVQLYQAKAREHLSSMSSYYCDRNGLMIMNGVTYNYEKGLQISTSGEGVFIG